MKVTDAGISQIIEQLQDMKVNTGAPLDPPLPPPPGRGTLRGMDPWQQSVEKRLDSLDGRAQRLEASVSDIRANVATLTEKVSALPTKEWVGAQFRNWIIGVGAFLSIVTVASRFIS